VRSPTRRRIVEAVVIPVGCGLLPRLSVDGDGDITHMLTLAEAMLG